MEYYLDSEESDDEIWFDEVTLKQFLKHVHCNRAAYKHRELNSSKVEDNKSKDDDKVESQFDKRNTSIRISEHDSKLNLCTKTVTMDCNKQQMDENFFMTDRQREKLYVSQENSKCNDNVNNKFQGTEYNKPKYKHDAHYKNIEVSLSKTTESCNRTPFKSTPYKRLKNIDTNLNTPLMESKLKISNIHTLSSPEYTTTTDSDESFSITEEQVNICDSPGNSESSDELNDTLELIECIFNNRHNDQDKEHAPEKEFNSSIIIEPIYKPQLHPLPNQNIQKCDLNFQATAIDCQTVHTDNSVFMKDKQGKILSKENADSSIELNKMLESVEYILTKSGTCISVYTCNISNQNIKQPKCNFATNFLEEKPRTPNYKILMSLSVKEPSPINLMKTASKTNIYHYTSSSLVAYIKNVAQGALLEDVYPKKPLPYTSSMSELDTDCCTIKHSEV